MKQVSLGSVGAVYDCARLAKIKVHHVHNASFHRFCLQTRTFERSLGESASDDYWRQFLRPLKQFRFDASSTPLPFKCAVEIQPNIVELLQERLANCNLIYPQFDSPARELVNSLLSLHKSPLSPIQGVCAGIAHGKTSVAMLIKEPRLIQAVEQMLNSRPEFGAVVVVSPSQLKSHACFSSLMVIGPTLLV